MHTTTSEPRRLDAREHAVTPDGCHAGEKTDSRHTPAEDYMASLRAEQSRAWSAVKTGEVCARCGRRLASAEPVWWLRVRRSLAPTCSECTPDGAKRRSVVAPCEHCGRSVGKRLPTRRTFCCRRCAWLSASAARRRRTELGRRKVCGVCGRSFAAARGDARTCSHACRQRAYRCRERRHGASELQGAAAEARTGGER
jgi:hypothetical protein